MIPQLNFSFLPVVYQVNIPRDESYLMMSNPSAVSPRIAITMGDAAGIGPEVVLKALADESTVIGYQPIIIGDFEFLSWTAKTLDIPIDLVRASSGCEFPTSVSGVIVYDLANLGIGVAPGIESGAAGRAAGQYIEAAVGLWRERKVDAISTAPINKKSLSLGGYDFPGHTEFLAALSGTKEFAMSFFAGDLRVVLLSTHISLIEAIAQVKKNRLADLIKFTHREVGRLLKRPPKIAVAGLNPHASEGGLFGGEEQAEIAPAIEYCRDKSQIDVTGPFSPDTIFLRAWRGEFDAVLSCYHDQATIAVKCLSFGESVNVTLGLPFIRTSVDHGTAFEIAGKNIADASSMKAAIKLAAELCR